MREFVLKQALALQIHLGGCQDSKLLIACTSHFLSLTLQPEETLFFNLVDDLKCIARHSYSKPIQHLGLFVGIDMTNIDQEKLWQLINSTSNYSPYLSISYLQVTDNGVNEWYCFKLKNHRQGGSYIFLKNPKKEVIKLWKTEPLLSAVVIQFFYLLKSFNNKQKYKQNLIQRDMIDAQRLQQLQEQLDFSSKVLKLHKITLDLVATPSLDALYKQTVETLRNTLGFDRTCLLLADSANNVINSTYGTDEHGNTTDESNHFYDMETLLPAMQEAALYSDKLLEVSEDTPLYTAGNVSGIGWNAMVILRDGDNLIGWIAIDNLIKKAPLLTSDRELLLLFSTMLSHAIVHKREEDNLKLLHNSIVRLSSLETEIDICRVAVEIALDKLRLDRIAIFLSHDDGKTMSGTYGTDVNGQLTDETYFKGALPENSILQLAIDHPNQLAFEPSVALYHDTQRVGYGWSAAMILRNQQEIIGFIVIDNLINQRPLSSHSKQLISLFSSNLAEIITRKRAEESVFKLNNKLEQRVERRTAQLALVNKELEKSNQKLAQWSLQDGLTGVANRRHFDETYNSEWKKACRHAQTLCVIMIDVDAFKKYNDHYGHLQGDTCLQRLSALLQTHYRRANEFVARFGGEEFVVLISQDKIQNCIELTEELIKKVSQEKIPHVQTEAQYISISAGLAFITVDNSIPPKQLIELADKALYRAKAAGKNRLCIEKFAAEKVEHYVEI